MFWGCKGPSECQSLESHVSAPYPQVDVKGLSWPRCGPNFNLLSEVNHLLTWVAEHDSLHPVWPTSREYHQSLMTVDSWSGDVLCPDLRVSILAGAAALTTPLSRQEPCWPAGGSPQKTSSHVLLDTGVSNHRGPRVRQGEPAAVVGHIATPSARIKHRERARQDSCIARHLLWFYVLCVGGGESVCGILHVGSRGLDFWICSWWSLPERRDLVPAHIHD